MEQSESLRSRIANLVDTLSPKQKRIARFILDDPYFASFASANELGEKNHTTAALLTNTGLRGLFSSARYTPFRVAKLHDNHSAFAKANERKKPA
jgi:hypothetical protein